MAEKQERSGSPARIDGSQILGRRTRGGREYKVKTYDFRRPDKFSREQVIAFSLLHESIARELAPILGSLFGEPVKVHLAQVDQLTLGELMKGLAEFQAFAIVDTPPLRGGILLRIDVDLAHALVHRCCGGAGFPNRPERPLTEIERVVLRDSLEAALPAIDDGWRRLASITCSVSAIETQSLRAMIVPPNEMILMATFEVGIADHDFTCTIAVPYLTLEPVVGRLHQQGWYSRTRRPGTTPALGALAADLAIDAEVAIDLGTVRLGDLQGALDEVALPPPASARIVLRAGGVDLAELSVPVDYLELEETLPIVRCARPDAAARLVEHEAEGPTLIATRVARSFAETLGAELKAIRESVDELAGHRAGEALPATGEEVGVSIDASQVRDVAIALSGESEQSAAFVLAPLEPEIASAVLSLLPEEAQPGIVRRIAELLPSSRELHRRVISFIARRASLSRRQQLPGGIDSAVKILGRTPRSVEKRVMERLRDEAPELFEGIAKRLFVFEDLVLLSPGAIEKLASQVAPEEFALALRRVPSDVSDHVLSSLEDEYRARVEESGRTTGPVRLRDVEEAQSMIIEELHALEEGGEVFIARAGEDEVVE